ncbi:hypothetical protein APR11_005511 [Nocardia amikacinitolerans]|uniref:hypothetical protein n=1 Tax=Nocardia amikacinitolerans TaxID=756689 RepID=UPI0020A26D3C|nr:hypothetical protein [Nocardia amikacinitolerans]MCP2299061.1 hypothetical protein [Nocardia amikacinitolerans]
MTDFTVDVASLTGFELDLSDLGTNFTTNAARLLPRVALPAGSAGLLATLAPAFEKFQSAIPPAHRTDLTAVEALATDLSTAGSRYRATDGTSAAAIAAITPDGTMGSSQADGSRDAKRFSGLQLPSLSDVQENHYTVRQVVTSAIDKIAAYDERLSATVGFKPAADYLTPLVADWEALQAVGRRIGLLGINDYVTSENLIAGTRWLQGSWSGEASRSFAASANTLGQSVAERSADLDAVAKIVENGGACLERLVYNQAMGLSSGILEPKSYLGATFPLGVWAQLINSPANESIRSELIAAFDSLKQSAQARQAAITMMIDKISTALDYSPGRTAPSCTASEFELADKIAVDLGATKYGFGDNVWWEDSVVSA